MQKKGIIFLIVAILAGGGIYAKIWAQDRGRFAEVKTSIVETGDIQSYLSTTAIIKSKDSKEYYGLQGIIKSVYVRVGDRVKAGDLLLTYETQDLNTALRQAEIQYNNAVLQKQELVNQDNQIRSKVTELEVQIKELEGSTNLMEQGKIENFKQQKSALQPISEERLQQAENSVELAKLNVESTKQRVKDNKDRIIAVNNGVVTEVSVMAGAMGNSMQPAVIIQDIENLKAQASVGRYDANIVSLGQSARIRTGKEIHEGKVSFVDPVAKRTMSVAGNETLLGVEIDILEAANDLKIDFSVDVDILLGEVKDVIKIPAESIRADREGRYFVYTVENQRAREKEITLGLQSDMEAEVLEGLQVGEIIILNPRNTIIDGSPVKIEVGGK